MRENVVLELGDVYWLQGSDLLTVSFDLLCDFDEDLVGAAQEYTITVEVFVGCGGVGFPSLAEDVRGCLTTHGGQVSSDLLAALVHGLERLEHSTKVNALMFGEFCTGCGKGGENDFEDQVVGVRLAASVVSGPWHLRVFL
jgi:hypothetical protein